MPRPALSSSARHLRSVLAVTAVTGMTCVGLGLAAPAASAAAAGPLVQAESLRPVAGRAVVFADRAASAGRGLAMVTNGVVRASMTTTSRADRLVLRVRGDQAFGAPRADVLVDGRRVGSVTVSSTRWVDATLRGDWAAGAHVVEVRFVNDAIVRGRDRNLRLDRVTFGAATPSSLTAAPDSARTFEQRLLQLANAERARAGLRALAPLDCATSSARAWSTRMAGTGVFAHQELDALRAACAQHGPTAWGENIAYGDATTPERMMASWMSSPGHRENLLDPTWTHLGTGIATDPRGRVYGTQTFYRLG